MILPDAAVTLADRADGGNLIVNPPREVWERSELSADELTKWSMLVASAGRAMLDALPQLEGGCINYWEAGNWALNDEAPPRGPKRAESHRRVHLHLLGRARHARGADWRWGEAPVFPAYADRLSWASTHRRLHADECAAIIARAVTLLREKYDIGAEKIAPSAPCPLCGYLSARIGAGANHCEECAPT